ncbi:hypothetical protein HAX54_036458, partial [Datura stramonium]|nr:hypothetical protein [Datura stramonium]
MKEAYYISFKEKRDIIEGYRFDIDSWTSFIWLNSSNFVIGSRSLRPWTLFLR